MAQLNLTISYPILITYTTTSKRKIYTRCFLLVINGHSQFWWPEGDTTPEGKAIDEITPKLELIQLINEPTNFEPNKNPSCIDLIFTDQPNLVLESGVRPSLDTFCHHQITHCRINYQIPPPPPLIGKSGTMIKPMYVL